MEITAYLVVADEKDIAQFSTIDAASRCVETFTRNGVACVMYRRTGQTIEAVIPKPRTAARCECYRGHASASGRCTDRDPRPGKGPALCQDCLTYCVDRRGSAD